MHLEVEQVYNYAMDKPVSTVKSPCVRNCCLNECDICLGCFRSIDEILAWSASTNQQRYNILEQAANRRNNHNQRYRQ